MRRRFLLLLAASSLVACAETSSCPDGTARRLDDDGHATGDCLPLGDGGTDMDGGGTDSGMEDAGEADAGPCGPCAADERCDLTLMDCVECNDTGGCESTEFCVDNVCVACRNDADCPLTDPVCTAGACGPCTGPSDCELRGTTTVCATGPGDCVECTDVDASNCSAGVCKPDQTCSDYSDTVGTCQLCDTDANCGAGRCIALDFEGSPRGSYCLPVFSGGCARPYTAISTARTSVDGRTQDICGIDEALTTCEAMLAIGDPCTATPCPEGGRCARVGTVTNLCTYPCDMDNNRCPSSPAAQTSCGIGDGTTGGTYCGG